MSQAAKCTVVSGPFDDMRSRDIRFLQEAARRGPLEVLLWGDALVRSLSRQEPKFPESERLYYLQAVRFVHRVHLIDALAGPEGLPDVDGLRPQVWAVPSTEDTPGRQGFCRDRGIEYHVVTDRQLEGFPTVEGDRPAAVGSRKKIMVTGCYDWFHTGHIRFFEECAELGSLYVVVGHDANIRLLKGHDHPMFGQEERRYVVGAIRYVTKALISTGHGWMDAEPQVEEVRPQMYAVNEDGDKPQKREFCAKHNIEYIVLTRLPKPGLPKRESTHLRGF